MDSVFFIKLLQFILSISLLVLLHEGGHFFFSKLFGVRVNRFYIFFNPKFHLFSTYDKWFRKLMRRTPVEVPVKVEKDLREILPPEKSSDFCHRMVLHGRKYCMARKPDCEHCPLTGICKKVLK